MTSGWQTSCLGGVLAVLKNGLNCKQDKSGKGQKVSRIESISRASFDLSRVGYAEISDQDRSKFRLSKGDILFSHINSPIHVGKTAVFDSDEEVYHGVNLLLMRPTPAVSGAFLELYLKYLFEQGYWLSICKQSVNQASVNQQDISRVPIAFPIDHREQRRIVAILDEAYEAIATAKANAEKNLLNAREVFASRMQVLFEQGDGWERVQLAELLARGWITSHLDGNHGSDYPRREEFVDAGVPYIAASAIKGGTVDFDEAKYLSPERAATIRKGLARDRDVLFAHNATVGPVAILRTDEDVVILGTSLTYYRCDSQRIHPEYLAHFMSSPAFTSQYAQVMKQSTRNQVPITKQREFFHVIPPIDVQRRIADDLDELLVQTERMTEIVERRVAVLDELKKSLLHEAFSGAL